MRIREILFHDVRAFRGERRISFLDPVTDTVRPLTVLVGSNGSGKTTVLEILKELLLYVITRIPSSSDLFSEASQSSFVRLTLELSPTDLLQSSTLTDLTELPTQQLVIAVGQREVAEEYISLNDPNICYYLLNASGKPERHIMQPATEFGRAILQRQQNHAPLHGGLLYFPADRQLSTTSKGAIEPPPQKTDWVWEYSSAKGWPGSLEQLWVWQNYLDLEAASQNGKSNRKQLETFVEAVEDVLGENRPITVSQGRVMVPTAWSKDQDEVVRVSLDQLPSGEKQVLLLFGELARHRRHGAVIAIDEVENSLHPTLQRLAMWNLQKFAREWDSQVIVTTHSQEVVNWVRGSALINLDFPEDQFNLPFFAEHAEGI